MDEINQGMDEPNERRVFDLLVRTSCGGGDDEAHLDDVGGDGGNRGNSQYFLLTPKLLPNLKYHRNMNVLVVKNGPGMCHTSKWDMTAFRARARAAAAV